MVGNMQTGHIVVPHNAKLETELKDRCRRTDRDPDGWVRTFQW